MKIGELWRVRYNHRRVHVYGTQDPDRAYYDKFELEYPDYLIIMDEYWKYDDEAEDHVRHSLLVLTTKGLGYVYPSDYQLEKVT